MGKTKEKLKAREATFGAWIMIGHPAVAEVLAGEGFDWLCVDMEHAAIGVAVFEEICRAARGSGLDVFARLGSCDAVEAKRALDAGADGIIVPCINTRAEAERAVAIAKYPPEGVRGTSLTRATDYGRNFARYSAGHNEHVTVVVMIEHKDALPNLDAILSAPGIDATFIGPYDLSASMGKAGKLEDAEVAAARRAILEACRRHDVPPGIHTVPVDAAELAARVREGYLFNACGIDTHFLMHGARQMLSAVKEAR